MQADVGRGALPETVVKSLACGRGLAKSLPNSYKIVVGGTVEESWKSEALVVAVVPVTALLMLTVLMFQCRASSAWHGPERGTSGSYRGRRALLLSGRPLGFVAILGILALRVITKTP